MTIKRLDHVGVVVDDLAAAYRFFHRVGMTSKARRRSRARGDRVNGSRVSSPTRYDADPRWARALELTKFRNPRRVENRAGERTANTLGLRSVMFTVESVDDTVARLRANGAEVVRRGGPVRGKYRLCYMRALRASSSRWPRNYSERNR